MSQEEFNQLAVKLNVLPLEEYHTGRSRILVECLVCRNQWTPVARNIIRGCGCPECGKQKAAQTKKWNISQTDFLSKVPQDFLQTVEILGDYQSQHSAVAVRCVKCGREWESSPYKLYRAYGCDVCKRKEKGRKTRKSQKHFCDEVFLSHGDAISVVGQYETGKCRVRVKCNQCGHFWQPVARRLLNRGCPRCCFSKGERKIERILDENNVPYKSQYLFDGLISPNGGKLRFDFAVLDELGSLGHLIEYDGIQHYRPFKRFGGENRFRIQKRNDELKNEYCRDYSIHLVRIPYTQYKQISLEMLLCKPSK